MYLCFLQETSVTFIILLNYLKLIYLVVAYGLAYLTIAPEILPYVTPSFTDFWLLNCTICNKNSSHRLYDSDFLVRDNKGYWF